MRIADITTGSTDLTDAVYVCGVTDQSEVSNLTYGLTIFTDGESIMKLVLYQK